MESPDEQSLGLFLFILYHEKFKTPHPAFASRICSNCLQWDRIKS